MAAGQPVTSQVGAQLAAEAHHLWEALRDEKVPGAASKTVTGHTHTGDGDGRSIPRMVYGEVWSLPIIADPATNDAVNYDAGDDPDGGNWVSFTLLSNAHNTPGWLQATAAAGASATKPNLIKAIPLRLRAGCKGIKVKLFRGVEIGPAPYSAAEIIWVMDLRPLVNGQVASATILDSVEHTVTADENAQWVDFPGVQPDATTANGSQSGSTYLACVAAAGDRLTADADFVLYVGFYTDSVSGSGSSSVLLYGALVYEVAHE